MNLDGSMLFYEIRSRSADGSFNVVREHEPLQLILDTTDDKVVDVDCDTMCHGCSIRAAVALGGQESPLRVSFWGEAPVTDRGVLIASAAGTEYAGVYLRGRTDLTTDLCARCGGETITTG